MVDAAGRAYVLAVKSSFGFVHEMMAGIAEALAHHGWRAELLDISGMQGLVGAIDHLFGAIGKGPALIVDYLAHHRLHTMRAFAAHDFFFFFSDAPYAYYDNLASVGANGVVGYSDETHAAFIDDHAMPFARRFFPHAGPEIAPGAKPLADRDYPFLFIGNLTRSPRLDGLAPARANADMRRLTDAVTARALDGGMEPYLAFKQACAALGIGPDIFPVPDQRASYLALIAGWVEARRRHDILVALGDRPIHFIGNAVPGFFEVAMPHLIGLGQKSTRDCIAAMANARVVVNSIGVRPAGAHERMWYGLAMGAAVWTDPTAMVTRDFPAGSLFSIPREARDIRQMADDIAGHTDLAGCVAAAQAVYATKHTWRVRVGDLLAHHRFEKATARRS